VDIPLESRGKGVLVIWWQTTRHNCFCGHWGSKLANDEIRYLAGEISSQSIEDVVWFLLAVYRKRQEERNQLRVKQSGT
jgi:hypothetical protein